jgi:hypothetical protein
MSESTPPPAPGQTDATPAPSGEVRNFPDAWAQRKSTPLAQLYAARQQAKWDASSLVTEAEFDAAVGKAGDITINAVHSPYVRAGEGK